ncbi:MAG: MjaI family restriction endonuclease [Ignavibacteriae bacterium]|nr:MjaI family restriction endonuclease [Ignavibacteriota bacterium]
MDFGKKEKVLNYTCQAYQLSRPNKVGAVMELIRECHPKTIKEWESWYFDNASTCTKNPEKITNGILIELGERLFEKITEVVIPEWQEAFRSLTKQDCIDYIYNLTINRTFDGYIREKSVINDGLAKLFPDLVFEESDTDLDHSGDVDFTSKVKDKLIGFQIKPVTAKHSFANYSPTERMKASFKEFEEIFGGKVFIIFSLDGEIGNKEIIDEIKEEINRLSK